MKPRTKIQKKVWKLRHNVPKITDKQLGWCQNMLDTFVQVKKYHSRCLDCDHEWKNDDNIIACPNCKRKLRPLEGKERTAFQWNYFVILSRVKEYQVIRYYLINKKSKVGDSPVYDCLYLGNIFIDPSGKQVTMFRLRNSYSYYCESWSWSSFIEIRNNSESFKVKNVFLYPKVSIIPTLKRNGFNLNIGTTCIFTSIKNLLFSPKHETLFKAGYYNVFESMYEDNVEKYWSSIKICIRNNYRIPDNVTWCDHVRMLERLRYDILNPKYICPEDLNDAHKKLIREYQIKEERRRIKDRINFWKENDPIYQNEKKKYLDIELTNGEILIKPLQNLSEFYHEGKTLKHCVYSNEYYKKKDSLILTARKNGERIETIELSLKDKKVIHMGGVQNTVSSERKAILKLLNKKNIHKILNVK